MNPKITEYFAYFVAQSTTSSTNKSKQRKQRNVETSIYLYINAYRFGLSTLINSFHDMVDT
jgi:hypothetical protein